MARYTCETGHEAQSHDWQHIGEGGMVPPGRYPACVQMVAGKVCRAFLHECSWCDKTATAAGSNETGRLYACDYHAEYLVAIAEAIRCQECGDAVDWPTEWLCVACTIAVAMTEGASL